MLITDPPYNVSYGQTHGHSLRPSEAKQRHLRKDGKIIMNDSLDGESFFRFLLDAFTCAKKHLEQGAPFYIFYAESEALNFRNAAKESGLQVRQTLIWAKNSFTLGRQDYQWKHEPFLYGWKDGQHFFFDSRKESTVVEDERPNLAKMSKADMRSLLDEIYSDKTATTVFHEDKPIRSDEHPTMKPVKLIARLIRNSSKKGWTVLDPFGGSGTTLIACEQLGRKCLMMELDPQYCDVIITRWERFTGRKAEKVDD